jgi:hypothetical protein
MIGCCVCRVIGYSIVVRVDRGGCSLVVVPDNMDLIQCYALQRPFRAIPVGTVNE